MQSGRVEWRVELLAILRSPLSGGSDSGYGHGHGWLVENANADGVGSWGARLAHERLALQAERRGVDGSDRVDRVDRVDGVDGVKV
jgi:hypothetical protein